MSVEQYLSCRVCGTKTEIIARSYCEECFGPLEVKYDLDSLRTELTRDELEARPNNLFRFRELLPLTRMAETGHEIGGTPLIPAPRLGEALGIQKLFLKNDAVNAPTLSFKDRVVGVALAKAKEFGFQTVGCASTGNLANSVAAQARRAGLDAVILIPAGLEPQKVAGTQVFGAELIEVEGNYDDVNRLCTQVAEAHGVGMVNVNLRPFYAEGSKSLGFETAVDLGWILPDAVVCPMAGGSLIGKIHKAFRELVELGLVEDKQVRIYGAQAEGCNPIVSAFEAGDFEIRPQKPNTIAKSLAIGNPADGYFASKLLKESGGGGASVTDQEIVDGIQLLARHEGILAETAGGVTIASLKRLVESNQIDRDGVIVAAITGNGLKTLEAAATGLGSPPRIEATLESFDKCHQSEKVAA